METIARGVRELGATANSGGGSSYATGAVRVGINTLQAATRRDGSLVVAADVEFLAPDPDEAARVYGEEVLRTNCVDAMAEMLESGRHSDCVIEVGAGVGPFYSVFLCLLRLVSGGGEENQGPQVHPGGALRHLRQALPGLCWRLRRRRGAHRRLRPDGGE